MLDSTVAMLKVLFALLLFFQDTPVAITSPQSGETLHGQVNITGSMNVPEFVSAELAFAYASDPTSTWFTIQTFSSPLPAGEGAGVRDLLAAWDTTVLTDGDYSLRLRVNLQNGQTLETVIKDLKILNDVPTPTATLTSTPEPEDTPVPTLPTATDVPAPVLLTYPTPTPLPANPATLTTPSIYSNFARGTAITLVLFFLIGLILRLRRTT